jgi:putative SOS response-associated peptidase YedK
MCGRYNILAYPEALLEHFGVEQPPGIDLKPRYNVAPSQDVPAIRQHDSSRELVLLHWGLIPFWAKDEKLKYSTINAKAETIAQKPAFRDAFKKRRCLIPASGFYEWRQEKGHKQPYNIRLKDEPVFAFAGLWEHWENPEGKVIESCSIIVTEANELIRPIHDRMPVILADADYTTWLDPTESTQSTLTSLLKPYPASEMELYPVSTAVNNPRNDGPDLIQSI